MLSTSFIPIVVSNEDKPLLADLIRRASYASHKLQKDFSLAMDKDLGEEIKHKYKLAAKHVEYLQADAVATGDAYLAREKMLVEQLVELQAKLAKAKKKDKQDDLKKKIIAKKRSMGGAVVFGGRHRLEVLSMGTSEGPKKLKCEYQRARSAPLFFQGERAR